MLIICLYLLVCSHVQVNYFYTSRTILDFKDTVLLFCRLLPCVNKMFIYKEKWHQVRDPQSRNILKGWSLARESMKRYATYNLPLHRNVLFALSCDRSVNYEIHRMNSLHYVLICWLKVHYNSPYH